MNSNISDLAMNDIEHKAFPKDGYYRKMVYMKRFQSDIINSYVMEHIKKSYTTTDPILKVMHLYTFKNLFCQSPQPGAMEHCIRNGLLSFLMQILGKEYDPSDSNNELVLYHLAMEILWQFSRVVLENPRLVTIQRLLVDKALIKLVSRFMDIEDRFYQFSAHFVHRLRSLCCSIGGSTASPLMAQRVQTSNISQTVWSDLLFYQPMYGPLRGTVITTVYRCFLTHMQLKENYKSYNTVDAQHKSSQITVAAQLISEGLAWHEMPAEPPRNNGPMGKSPTELVHSCRESSTAKEDCPPSKQADKDGPDGDDDYESLEDIIFLDFIGGNYFWAYVGDSTDVTLMLKSMEEMMWAQLPFLKNVTQPEVGDKVIVVIEQYEIERNGGHCPSVMRGRVIKVCDFEVTVLAVDYGKVVKVRRDRIYDIFSVLTPSSSVSMSQQQQQLVNLKPLAKLCCLAGVHPPPAAEAIVELGLAFMTNMTRSSSQTGSAAHHIHGAGCIDNLLRLMKIAPPSMQQHAMRLVSNIASTHSLNSTINWAPFIRMLLQMVTCLKQGKDMDNIQAHLLVTILYALTNILFNKARFKAIFFNLNGQCVILNAIRQNKGSYTIVHAAMAVLRVVFCGLLKTLPKNLDKFSACDFTEDSEEDDGDDLNLPNKDGSSISSQVLDQSDEDSQGMMTHWPSQKQQSQKLRKAMEDEDGRLENMMPNVKGEIGDDGAVEAWKRQEENGDHRNSPKMLKMPFTRGVSLPEAEGLPDTLELITAEAVTLNTAQAASYSRTVEEEGVACYQLNNYAPFMEGLTHHFLDVEHMSSIVVDDLAKLITGMLNSEGGTIHIGITKKGIVRGLKVIRPDRVFLRLAVEEVMSRTNPVISHHMVDLQYIMVKHRNQSDPCQDVFVTEIQVKPPVEKLYYTVEKGMVCYQRISNQTVPLTEQDVRELTIKEEELQYIPIVGRLQNRIQQLKNEISE